MHIKFFFNVLINMQIKETMYWPLKVFTARHVATIIKGLGFVLKRLSSISSTIGPQRVSFISFSLFKCCYSCKFILYKFNVLQLLWMKTYCIVMIVMFLIATFDPLMLGCSIGPITTTFAIISMHHKNSNVCYIHLW